MIQAALDALPESEDIDMKSSSIKGNEDLQNGDSGSQMSGPAKLGCSPIDTALCLVADEMFMSIDWILRLEQILGTKYDENEHLKTLLILLWLSEKMCDNKYCSQVWAGRSGSGDQRQQTQHFI